jgi:general secretion pathway protein C
LATTRLLDQRPYALVRLHDAHSKKYNLSDLVSARLDLKNAGPKIKTEKITDDRSRFRHILGLPMPGILDFFKRKNNSSEETNVGISNEATRVGPRSSLLDLPRKFPRLPRFGEESQFETFLPYIFVLLLALMAADLTTVGVRSYMIPAGAPPSKRQNLEAPPYKPLADYGDILSRNIFNSDGFIPEVQVADSNAELDTNTARETSLPLTLIGTIVHANPGKSVATIQEKGNADKVLPYIPNDEIEGLATLIRVERKKVFIRNLSAGTLEYIQIKDDSTLAFSKKVVQDGPIEKDGNNTFAISRSDLETQMSNLPELLTQARAVPNLVPGGNGKIDGFRILDVVEGSLYTKLGIKTGDIIKGVDGEPVDSPAKAMELYNSLRSKAQVQLTLDRNGTTSTMTYNIR